MKINVHFYFPPFHHPKDVLGYLILYFIFHLLIDRWKQELESKAREGRLVGDPKLTETIKMFR